MDLAGSWKLVSAVGTAADSTITKPWGDDPVGFLTYTEDGRMWGLISSSGRKRLSGDWASAPADERKK